MSQNDICVTNNTALKIKNYDWIPCPRSCLNHKPISQSRRVVVEDMLTNSFPL